MPRMRLAAKVVCDRQSEAAPPSRSAGLRATTLYSVDPFGIRTMMQSCASTARLLGGGPTLSFGMEAIGAHGLPPPRIISALITVTRDLCRDLSVCLVVLPNHSCRGMQRHAGRHLAGRDVAPQRDQ